MIKFTGTVSKITLDKGRYTKALAKAIKDEIKNAVAEFIRTADPKVPVRTGMAKGSLAPLARFAAEPLNLSGAMPTQAKNAQAGEDLSELEVNLDSFPKFSLHFSVGTRHYELMDSYPMPQNRREPWGSMEAGRKAFLAYLKEHLRANLPRIKDFFKYTTVRIR